MNEKKYLLTVVLAIICAGFLMGQKVQNRETDPFDQITVFGKLEVYIQKGSKTNVKLESDEIDLDNITTRTDGKELKISLSEKLLSNTKKAKITITYNSIKKISANAGSEVNTVDTLVGKGFELESFSGSSLYVYAKCDSIDIDISSGSLVSIEGTAGQLDIEVGTRATFSGYEFICNNANVKANSGGLAKVKVTGSLNASATTKGNIIYDGEPKMKKVKETLGGKVEMLTEQ